MNCVNPKCDAQSLYFRSGSLHCIDCLDGSPLESNGKQRQTVWLCPECSKKMAVESWRPPGQQIRMRRAAPHSPLASWK
jgi:ribosomal protein L37AE/L43A